MSIGGVNTLFSTATLHVLGVTGFAFAGASPGLILFTPLVGGLFFATLERFAADTAFQPVLILARDACLIIPKVTEIASNEVLVGPVTFLLNNNYSLLCSLN